MELPFYLMSLESAGASWDGVVSLEGKQLHFELRGGTEEERTEFDVPLEKVKKVQFERGLVSRKLSLTVRSEEIRQHFPAGVSGEEVHLMVARDDSEFGSPNPTPEGEYERLVGEIAERTSMCASQTAQGLTR